MISRRLPPASVLLLLLGACSGSQGTTEEEAAGPAEKDPPGVAQALSLGGQLEEDSGRRMRRSGALLLVLPYVLGVLSWLLVLLALAL